MSSILIAISDQRKQRRECDPPKKRGKVVVVGRFLGPLQLYHDYFFDSVFFSEIISLWSWEKEWMPEETPLYRMLRFLVLCCQPPRPLDAGDRVSILQVR